MRNRSRIWIWIPAVIVANVIFLLSSENGRESVRLSNYVTERMFHIASGITDQSVSLQEMISTDNLHFAVRKLGHFTEYAILAISILYPLQASGIHKGKAILLCMAICIVYACSDEFHQLFITDRTGQAVDVAIDSMGAFAGMIFYYSVTFLLQKTRLIKELAKKEE